MSLSLCWPACALCLSDMDTPSQLCVCMYLTQISTFVCICVSVRMTFGLRFPFLVDVCVSWIWVLFLSCCVCLCVCFFVSLCLHTCFSPLWMNEWIWMLSPAATGGKVFIWTHARERAEGCSAVCYNPLCFWRNPAGQYSSPSLI